MSFFGKLANIFGMGETDEVFEDSPETIVHEHTADNGGQTTQAVPSALEFDKQKEEAIFEHVVTVFIASLPDFFARSVDPQKQRKCLYDSLDASLKEYLDGLRLVADENAKASWQAEHDRLMAEAAALKKRPQSLKGPKAISETSS